MSKPRGSANQILSNVSNRALLKHSLLCFYWKSNADRGRSQTFEILFSPLFARPKMLYE